MICGHDDITDQEYEDILVPFYNNLDEFMLNYIVPEVVAFYLADSRYKKCLYDSTLTIHINSIMDIFNRYKEDINKILPSVRKILRIKYNLKITKTNPLRLEKVL
jgi:hypothetical protein